MIQQCRSKGFYRAFSVGIGGIAVELPCFFPSISSVKANLPVLEYLRLLVGMEHPLFLISAYDIHHAQAEDRSSIQSLIDSSLSQNTVVLMDSGNYESFWMNDQTWSPESFTEVRTSLQPSLALSFDQSQPCDDLDTIVEWVVEAVESGEVGSMAGSTVPIVHGPKELLPDSCKQVAQRLAPIVLAVAERELGDGIIERARTVASIRKALDELDHFCALHLLGTGNPLSILAYAFAGADSFDGLEWCQTCVDHESGRLYHLQQWDFFRDQTPIGKLDGLPYSHMVMTHNLLFYARWLDSIRKVSSEGNLVSMLQQYLPEPVVNTLASQEGK